MDNFFFHFPTEIDFGKSKQKEVGKKLQGQNVLILYGSDRVERSGLLGDIEESLQESGVPYTTLSGVSPNPRLSKVIEGVELCRRRHMSFILAVGGGSCIDTAKAIALGMEDSDFWDYFANKRKCSLQVKAKIGVILTIAGSGSETSSTTVITNDMLHVWEKKDFSYYQLKPVFAILNPELTLSVSWEDTVFGGIDMLSHVLERYFSPSKHNDLTSGLCESVMRTIIDKLNQLKEHPDDYNARAELMWAATIAHSNFLSTGRVGDWATHTMEHKISGIYDIKHGAGIAILSPAWMKYVWRKHTEEFEQFAREVWALNCNSTEETAYAGIEAFEAFLCSLGAATTFEEIGITQLDKPAIAADVAGKAPVGAFEELYPADIEQILTLAEGQVPVSQISVIGENQQ